MKQPKHVAFIMDGNGRWAKQRLMRRVSGHKQGLNTVTRVLRHARECGIEVVSLYVFSTENWHRPQEEVNGLFRLAREFLAKTDFAKEETRIIVSGDCSGLPEDLKLQIRATEQKTEKFSFIVNLCIDYGGRDELLHAVNTLLQSGVTHADENTLRAALYQPTLPDPDFIIRTGGEKRLSNFLLFQSAYAELYFTETLWPDFTEEEFDLALQDYSKRKRKFGRIEESE